MSAGEWWLLFVCVLAGVAFARAQIFLIRARKLLHDAGEIHQQAMRQFNHWQKKVRELEKEDR